MTSVRQANTHTSLLSKNELSCSALTQDLSQEHTPVHRSTEGRLDIPLFYLAGVMAGLHATILTQFCLRSSRRYK